MAAFEASLLPEAYILLQLLIGSIASSIAVCAASFFGSSCNNGQASVCLVCVLGNQVNIRRRETERQEATRLQSHAYLKQLEEAEVRQAEEF